MDVPIELFTKFNDVEYFDEPHEYSLNGNKLISVTTLIHEYQEEFNEDYWSNYKANELGLSQREIIRAWDFINKKGTLKGSIIHDYSENLFNNKIFEYPKEKIFNEFGFDPIINEYNITKNHVDKFYKDTHGKLIPIKMELVVYDLESLIGGMLDSLFYNVKANELQIWDNKTNKALTTENKWGNKLLGCLSLLDDCDLEIYSLQLELYKYIIEKNTPLKLGKSYIVWFSHNNDSYEIIETYNRRFYVEQLVKERIATLAQ